MCWPGGGGGGGGHDIRKLWVRDNYWGGEFVTTCMCSLAISFSIHPPPPPPPPPHPFHTPAQPAPYMYLHTMQTNSSSRGVIQAALVRPSWPRPPTPSPSYPPPAPTTPSSSNVGGWSGKKRVRSFDFEDNPKRRRSTPYSARQSGDKQHNKGLRHFSQRVCEKVREKGTTTYNEVR